MVLPRSPVDVRKGRLTATDAAHIFKAKLNRTAKMSAQLAEEYGVTSKAIRDVWSLKTWVAFTKPYWAEEDKHRFTSSTPLTGVQSAEQAFVPERSRTLAKPIVRSIRVQHAPTRNNDDEGDRATVSSIGASIDAELVKLAQLQRGTDELRR